MRYQPFLIRCTSRQHFEQVNIVGQDCRGVGRARNNKSRRSILGYGREFEAGFERRTRLQDPSIRITGVFVSTSTSSNYSQYSLRTRPIIRDMLAIEESSPSELPKVINLSDPDIETGVVIKSFLDICFHQEYQVLDRKVAGNVIDFAQKYEFNTELDRIELALFRRLLANPQCGYKYLFLAAALGNWQLCGLCISSLQPCMGADLDTIQGRMTTCRAIDLKTQDLADFRDIYRFGPSFTMGMVKAGDLARKGSSIDYPTMGKVFTQLMIVNGKWILISDRNES